MTTVTTIEQALAEAYRALDIPTTYLLGAGGYVSGARPTMPGRAISKADLRGALDKMAREKPDVRARYDEGLAKAGITLDELPEPACDCSGFITWVLGIPRVSRLFPGDGWLSTDNIHVDATGMKKLFSAVPQAWPDALKPGMLLVYPRDPRQKNHVGHIGIVTSVEGGRAMVMHCAPDNMLMPPAAGTARNAIAITDVEHFAKEPATIAVRFNAMSL